MAFDPFRSSRLAYRAVEESDEDNAFLHSLQLDIESLSFNTMRVLVPRNKAQSKKLGVYLRDSCRLGVLICLPPGTEASTTSETVSIGFIALKQTEPKLANSESSAPDS